MKNIKPGIHSLYNTCIDYQRYASAIAKNTNTPPTTRVSPDGMKISYNQYTLNIASWRAGLQILASEIKAELEVLCMGQDSLLQIPKETHDNWTNEVRGDGWTTADKYLEDPRCLLKAMLNDPQGTLGHEENGRLILNTAQAWSFIHKCDSLNEKLALLAFLTAGQTPRVAEFIDHKYANSTRPRTIFRDEDGLWLTTRRTKTEQSTKKETFLPIKCHPLLTKFLEQYLLIVRPVESDLIHFLRGEKAYHVYKEYMWTHTGERMQATQMYDFFKNFMTSYCNVPIGVHDYRQIAVEIGRVFLGSEFEVDEEEKDVLAEQAGHSAQMAHFKYAAEVGHLPSMSSDLLLRYGRISESWWAVTGFKPNAPPTLPRRFRAKLQPDSTFPDLDNPSILSLPTNESPGQIQSLIAALFSEIHQLRGDIRQEVRSAVGEALAGKQPLAFTSRSSPQAQPDLSMFEASNEDSMYSTPHPFDDGQAQPIQTLLSQHHSSAQQLTLAPYNPTQTTSNYLHGLLARHFPLIHNPKFKSLTQMEAVEMAIARKKSFIAVLPTGAGKSLIFTLPPFNEVGFSSYVIVPNKSLLQDQMERAKKIGLKTCVWSASREDFSEEAQLVFLAMESAGSSKFNE